MCIRDRALAAEPQLLILDEPESNLDFKNQLIILETIWKLARERGISAIVNTHYPAHALKLSDKALLLNREGPNWYGPTAQVISEENMRYSFGVNAVSYTHLIPLTGYGSNGRNWSWFSPSTTAPPATGRISCRTAWPLVITAATTLAPATLWRWTARVGIGVTMASGR